MRIYRDIAVSVVVHYLRHESNPSDLRWVFAYTITIKNNGQTPMQLINRHWEISSGTGNDVETVDGPGVVGKQPRLEPNDAFEYTSAAVLESSFGEMKGHYNFRDDAGYWYRVPIDPFILSIPSETLN
ncbi:MAG: Co2+/Mg2+ efflux protein ApaG [Gammaproteobacteria bacterium]|nr:Co2+/Mg2+ efflux protein ApaG [Gammaproteobacteria bacterium]